jgi:nicotinamidase-related amidase
MIVWRELRRGLALAVAGALALALGLVGSPAAVGAQTVVDLSVPGPATVSLDPSTTTFLVIDYLESTCQPNPTCVASLPAMSAALDAARQADAHVIYSVHTPPDNVILPPVAPHAGEPVFIAAPGDKFFNSDLDTLLRQLGTSTLILSGVSSNSGVLYTAGAAVQRGYTVLVVQDGIAAASDLATTVALWQLIHGPGANPQNTPLQPRAVTLTRTDLISYDGGAG